MKQVYTLFLIILVLVVPATGFAQKHGTSPQDSILTGGYHVYDTACVSFEWNHIWYYTTGQYTDTLTNVMGGDSVVTLHLIIFSPETFEFADTACESYQWNDSTYYTTGDYIQYFKTSHECDSVVTLHLTINNASDSTEFIATACNSYEWQDSIYTETGDYTKTLSNAANCDSVVTLHLTINYASDSTEISATACNSYEWQNSIYTESGDYTKTLSNAANCDSVVTLHLTIYPNYDTSINAEICQGDSFIFFGQTLTQSGYYSHTLQSVYGCDSTIFLNLTVGGMLDTTDIVSKRDANGTPYMLVYPQAGLFYQWYKDEVLIETATEQYYAPKEGLLPGACYQVRVARNLGSCGTITTCWKDTSMATVRVRILPNPNDGQFQLQLPDDAVSVQILNANGQVVMTRKADGDELLEMNIGLANGLYFVKTFLKDGSFNTEKLIINR